MTIGTAMVASTKVRRTGCQRAEPVAEGQVEDGEGREDGQPDHQGQLVFGRRSGAAGRRIRGRVVVWRGGHADSFEWACVVGAGVKPWSRSRTALRTSSSTRSALRAMAAAEPAPAAVMTWARGSTMLPAAQTPGTLVRPVVSTVTQPSASTSQPRPTSRALFGTKRGGTNSASRGNDAAVVHLHAAQLVRVVDDQLVDGAFDDADGAGEQLGSLGGGEDVGRGEVDEVVGPLANDLGVPDGARGAADDAEPPVADLVAVAVGAVQDIAGPPVAQAGDVRQLVAQAGRDQQSPGRDPLPAGEEGREPARPSGTRSVTVPSTISPP